MSKNYVGKTVYVSDAEDAQAYTIDEQDGFMIKLSYMCGSRKCDGGWIDMSLITKVEDKEQEVEINKNNTLFAMESRTDETMVEVYDTDASEEVLVKVVELTRIAYCHGAGTEEHEFAILVSLLRSMGYDVQKINEEGRGSFYSDAIKIVF